MDQHVHRSELVRDALSRVRDMGGGTPHNYSATSREGMKEHMRFAEERLPKDWIDAASKRGELHAIWADDPGAAYQARDRGYCDWSNGEIAVSRNNSTGDAQRTAVHEMVHRVEDTNPRVLQLEREHFAMRTKGDTWSDLKPEGMPGEYSKRDHWYNPYLGKEYGAEGHGRGYEIMTMGTDALLSGHWDGRSQFSKDEETYKFVLGVLAGA